MHEIVKPGSLPISASKPDKSPGLDFFDPPLLRKKSKSFFTEK